MSDDLNNTWDDDFTLSFNVLHTKYSFCLVSGSLSKLNIIMMTTQILKYVYGNLIDNFSIKLTLVKFLRLI